jgi:hypothetical protein
MSYQIGDKVEWDVRSRTDMFSDITHVGTVVGIVPDGWELGYGKFSTDSPFACMRLPKDNGSSRNHESYIVFVPGATPRSKGKLYWPRVSGLRKVKP